jgi:predicted PurR-regulated permease PerM
VESRTLPLPADIKWRRLLGVVIFLGLLYFFRSLAPVFICFVILERSLGWAADQIDRRTGLHRKGAIAVLLTLLASLLGLGAFFGVRRLLPLIRNIRENGSDYLRSIFHNPSIEKLRSMAGLEDEALSKAIKGHAGTAIHYATETAHLVLFLLIGFVLAIIYLFERDELHTWGGKIASSTVSGTLIRWFGYVGDSIAITVRMQAIVALVNAAVTLPVLFALRLPNIPLLFLLILVSGLVPVVGNIVSGAVLCYVAYSARGWWAVGVFLGVTFVLGKIESYYLNPRLAAQHVKLPSLVLVISLLLFEQAFGFVGLFLSFPALYVASRIAYEWREKLDAPGASVSPVVVAVVADASAESVDGAAMAVVQAASGSTPVAIAEPTVAIAEPEVAAAMSPPKGESPAPPSVAPGSGRGPKPATGAAPARDSGKPAAPPASDSARARRRARKRASTRGA